MTDVESVFSHKNSIFSNSTYSTESSFHINDTKPLNYDRKSVKIDATRPNKVNSISRTSSNIPNYKSFNIINSDNKYLKIKILYNRDYLIIKLRKDKLNNLQDLENVIKMKISRYSSLMLYFQNKSLKPIPLNELFNDLILDYVLTKDKIYIKAI
ncbi:hypothetical protein CLIB1444_05S08702 [[Candida] jaroonii]|uniref:Uncharacterized protein n=1 Tax=[Candida] jaroonii TaxID=467808 RepID=A0ACA9Y8I5_9ASCO|nr:hypothetical protein CLIB1444_05S08702 [[Candida] jaroonii]